ncbi:hypothetical protein [Devosia nitrariae]|uniref:Uncharacterized protein n=1 Tax=Devosia nitrariae TaxID=2071872 RepID=A0ABQ5W5S6_9HYPH|nr:hypothetical protein [Devosia nitrariae]GLQ55430.1 hypothetical protein GCM10010862_26890 [Devosia nitrariae]
MTKTAVDWAHMRAFRFSNDRPDDWPPDVDSISLNGVALLGIHRKTGELYWDGNRLVTAKRFSNFERGLAVVTLLIVLVGVTATVVQAWAAVVALP